MAGVTALRASGRLRERISMASRASTVIVVNLSMSCVPKGIIRSRDNRMSRGSADGHKRPVVPIRPRPALPVQARRKALAKQNTPYHNIAYEFWPAAGRARQFGEHDAVSIGL